MSNPWNFQQNRPRFFHSHYSRLDSPNFRVPPPNFTRLPPRFGNTQFGNAPHIPVLCAQPSPNGRPPSNQDEHCPPKLLSNEDFSKQWLDSVEEEKEKNRFQNGPFPRYCSSGGLLRHLLLRTLPFWQHRHLCFKHNSCSKSTRSFRKHHTFHPDICDDRI